MHWSSSLIPISYLYAFNSVAWIGPNLADSVVFLGRSSLLLWPLFSLCRCLWLFHVVRSVSHFYSFLLLFLHVLLLPLNVSIIPCLPTSQPTVLLPVHLIEWWIVLYCIWLYLPCYHISFLKFPPVTYQSPAGIISWLLGVVHSIMLLPLSPRTFFKLRSSIFHRHLFIFSM